MPDYLVPEIYSRPIPPSQVFEAIARTQPKLDLTGSLSHNCATLIGSGGYGDVYRMKYSGTDICVKQIRFTVDRGKQKVVQWARKEASVWWSLKHKNILPFLGYCSDFGDSVALISPYISGGDLLNFLIKRAPKSEDRLSLVSGIAEGLDYMHGHDISHGDLKCSNVLVAGTEDQPVPLLCDFGLSKVSGVNGYTTENEGTYPWMAKEILRDGGATPAGDIWSWGMTVLEVMTEARPFCEYPGLGIAIGAHILEGNLPSRPGALATERGLSDELWQLLLKCWSDQPELRPSASGVVQEISDLRDLGGVGAQ